MGARTRAADRCGLGRQLMCVDPERIGFVGPMGDVMQRSMGALTIYLALDAPLRIRSGDTPWRSTWSAVIPPLMPHGFISAGRRMAALMIEPEVIAWRSLAPLREADLEPLRQYLRQHYETFLTQHDDAGPPPSLQLAHCQRLAFTDAPLRRHIDPRIARVIATLRSAPQARVLASDCADDAHLSLSRFLHLFREQTGLSFRSFVAWKRARLVLETLRQGGPLTTLALDAGYPDPSYFSNSLRAAYGLTPREMFARCAQTTLRVGNGQDTNAAARLPC